LTLKTREKSWQTLSRECIAVNPGGLDCWRVVNTKAQRHKGARKGNLEKELAAAVWRLCAFAPWCLKEPSLEAAT